MESYGYAKALDVLEDDKKKAKNGWLASVQQGCDYTTNIRAVQSNLPVTMNS